MATLRTLLLALTVHVSAFAQVAPNTPAVGAPAAPPGGPTDVEASPGGAAGIQASPGEASPSEASGVEFALEEGRVALEEYTRGDWKAAYTRFATAERLVHSPVFVLYMARCKRNLGELLRARELFRKVARENITAAAPAPWQNAVASAHAELGAIQQSIPSLLLRSRSPGEIRAIKLDGASVEVNQGSAEIELDPGPHVIQVQLRDGRRLEQRVDLVEGRRRVPIDLDSQPPRQVPLLPVPAASVPVVPVRSGMSMQRALAFVSVGAGAAGLGVGIVAGLVARDLTEDIKDRCSGDVCLPRDKPKAERASDWAAVSTVGFIVGGVGIATGTGLLLLSRPASGQGAVLSVQRGF